MIRPVNDYRIGNYILDEDGELCIVEQLSSQLMGCYQQGSNVENKNCINSKYPSNIYAIQLTEEWLLEFGFDLLFQTCYRGRYSNFTINGIWVYFFTDKNTVEFRDNDFKIKYVHQLQNVWFALTGEELTIK